MVIGGKRDISLNTEENGRYKACYFALQKRPLFIVACTEKDETNGKNHYA